MKIDPRRCNMPRASAFRGPRNQMALHEVPQQECGILESLSYNVNIVRCALPNA